MQKAVMLIQWHISVVFIPGIRPPNSASGPRSDVNATESRSETRGKSKDIFLLLYNKENNSISEEAP